MENLDKKAFLAFALSMLLFVGFYWWYAPKMEVQRARRLELARQQQVADSIAAASKQPVREEESPSAYSPAKPDTIAKSGGGEQRFTHATRDQAGIIHVTSSLYDISLSSAGAEIVSIRLLSFTTNGEPVELLPDEVRVGRGTPGAASIVLDGKEEDISLSDVLFQPYVKGSLEPLPDNTTISLNSSNRDVELRFEARSRDGGRIVRHYTFAESSYVVKTGVRVQSAIAPSLLNVVWGIESGLRSTEQDTVDDYTNFQVSTQLGEEVHRSKLRNFSKKHSEEFEGTVRWASLQTKYFITALIPDESSSGRVEFTGRHQDNVMAFTMELPVVEKRGVVAQTVSFYLGPLDLGRLRALDVGLGQNVSMGYKMIRPVSRLVLWSMIKLHAVIPNYGLVIILLSIVTKVLFYRLTHKSFKSMRDMQQLQPKLQAIKEKYKDDRQKVSTETMKLYKEAGVNPLGGCLPMLLQMPVFIALFSVLKFTIELRQAPFLWWIDDLSRQDVMFHLPFTLPIIGNVFSLLPLLMGAGMLLQTKIGGSITGSAPAGGQPKAFTYMMPVIFTFIFYRMPSGLVLYWFVNNILSIGQQYYINKEVPDDTTKETTSKTRKDITKSKLPKKQNKKDR